MFNVGWIVNWKFNILILCGILCSFLLKNLFIGFYFVKLNWVIVCIFILIKLVNDGKIVVNKIDGVLGIYVF